MPLTGEFSGDRSEGPLACLGITPAQPLGQGDKLGIHLPILIGGPRTCYPDPRPGAGRPHVTMPSV